MRELLEYMLTKEGYRVSCAENGRKAISMIETTPCDLLICDIRLGDISGLDVLKATKKISPQTVVIMISAFTTTETAVESMNEGAFDFVPKPFNNLELKQTIANALTLRPLKMKRSAWNRPEKDASFWKNHRQFPQNDVCL